jgi:sugar lactone lactonase YvrE
MIRSRAVPVSVRRVVTSVRREVLLVVVAAVALPAAVAASAPQVERVLSFDPPQLPEGVAVDTDGNIYVGFAPTGQLLKLTPAGTQSIVATLPVGGGFTAGLAVDRPGNVYVALASFDPATHGVWRVRPDGSTAHLAALPPTTLPNGLAFDRRGNLFVSDSFGGAVWRIPPGEAAELWIQDELLVGRVPSSFPIGANGVAFRKDNLFVANTEFGRIVRIPVDRDGSAGEPETFVQDERLFAADGITFDVKGRLYAATGPLNTLVRVDRHGDISTLATAADGLDFPASLAFGTRGATRGDLYITNFALFTTENPDPALLRVRVGVPGRKLAMPRHAD